jgi:hypothetical protein
MRRKVYVPARGQGPCQVALVRGAESDRLCHAFGRSKKIRSNTRACPGALCEPAQLGTWVDGAADDERHAATAYTDALAALTVRQMKALADAVPSARIVTVRDADHQVYLSNEADVLREMRSFLNSLG